MRAIMSLLLLATACAVDAPAETRCASLNCDDGNPCTEDRCDEASGCSNPVVEDLLCDDGDRSTGGDRCGADGACRGEVIVCAAGPCVLSSEPNGVDCDTVYAEPGAACDDEDPSTAEDQCDAEARCVGEVIVCPVGPCIVGGQPNGVDCNLVYSEAGEGCDDEDPSTRRDACDGAGQCAGEPGPCTGRGCEQCAEEVQWPAEGFEAEANGSLDGRIELAQTHILRGDETRRAPRLAQGRETTVFFSPTEPIDEQSEVRVELWLDDGRIAALRAQPPSAQPPLLEQALTATPLEPYSDRAWTFVIPHHQLREGLIIRIGLDGESGLKVFEHQLNDLAPPHEFTISRHKMVLFGQPDDPTETTPIETLAQDFFAALPSASLRIVDALPWRLDAIVAVGSEGPRLVRSEAERLRITGGRNRYGLFRHHLAFRHNLANTGRGLDFTGESEGNNSLFSFGTSVAMGWLRDENGAYRDINNGGVAGGWTGWSALWLGECENVFIHEVGHSLTLAHFTGGTAARWGIGDEYPQDGTNLASHPWGFDSSRRMIRTWYRVDADGPVQNDQGLVGKRDPMNGGEPANAVTCFPQYTAFHAQKAQNWMINNPTLRIVEGEPGFYRWNDEAHRYDPEPTPERHQPVRHVGVPTMFISGTIGARPEVRQIYPPIHAISGNVFAMPDPESRALHNSFNGSHYFLEVDFADGPTRRAMINAAEPDAMTLRRFSINLAADELPIEVRLMRSRSPYPAIDVGGAELQFRRVLNEPEQALPPLVVQGAGQRRGGAIRLGELCTPGIDCDQHSRQRDWLAGAQVVSFRVPGGEDLPDPICSEDGGFSRFSVPVQNEEGDDAELVLHGQRVIDDGGLRLALPMGDRTPWRRGLSQLQSLRLWLPYGPNADLPAGQWRSAEPFVIARLLDGDRVESVPVELRVSKRSLQDADISGGSFRTETVASPRGDGASSVYYVVADGRMGPTGRVWWDGPPDPVLLSVPMMDEDSGELLRLSLKAWKVACDRRWDLNSGQANWPCDNHVRLEVAEAGNQAFVAGRSYRSPPSSPLRLLAKRWHGPNPNAVLAEHNLRLSYSPPQP